MLSNPDQLTPEVHAEVLSKLCVALSQLQKSGKAQSVRVRDWLFAFSDGQPAAQVFLELVEDTKDVAASPSSWRSPSLSDCAKVHRCFLDSDVFAALDDSVQIEVGSLGANPPLRTPGEFLACVGGTLDLLLWGEGAARRLKGARLLDVLSGQNDCSIVAEYKNQRLTVTLGEVRSAILITMQEPASPKRAAKPGLNGKFPPAGRDKS